jgi:hypothetical protein
MTWMELSPIEVTTVMRMRSNQDNEEKTGADTPDIPGTLPDQQFDSLEQYAWSFETRIDAEVDMIRDFFPSLLLIGGDEQLELQEPQNEGSFENLTDDDMVDFVSFPLIDEA